MRSAVAINLDGRSTCHDTGFESRGGPGRIRIVRDLTSGRGTRQEVAVQLHNLRLSFKQRAYDRFVKQDRRENRNLFAQYTKVQLQDFFLQVDLAKTRKLLDATNGAGRAIVPGSFPSPMTNHKSDAQMFRASCP